MGYLPEVIRIVKNVATRLFREDMMYSLIDKGSPENYATSVDLEIERVLRDRLTRVIPGSVFIGEESDITEDIAEYMWVVDPIDGTANFVRGIKECCISVGLLKDGSPILGVVYAPWLDELYAAEDGYGVTLNDKPIKVSDRDFRHSIHYVSACSYNKAMAYKMLSFVGKLCPEIEDIRRFGSAALAMCNIAAGRIETYHVTRICPWDVCAGMCILRIAGGHFITLNNDGYIWKSKFDLMAANSWSNLEELNDRWGKYEKGFNGPTIMNGVSKL